MGQRGTHRLACLAQPRPDWKPHPWTIHFSIGQDAFEIGATSLMPERGDALEGEPAVRRPRRCHLDTARREAPGPWRIGGRDDAGIHVLDANEERVATIWNTPSRSVSALEAIEALVVRVGDEVLATRLCANPECGRAFDSPNRRQKHCSSVCGVATQPRVIEARKRDRRAYELRVQGFKWKEVAERCGYSDPKRARNGAGKHARRNGLSLPTRG